MATVIHHNPDCSKSRNVLTVIRASGTEPIVIKYLDSGWTRPQLLALFAAANLTPRSALRTRTPPATELGLLAPNVSDDTILDAMVKHPALVERPIVCTPKGVALCRPAENILPLLEIALNGPVYNEDGSEIMRP
ncbi:arsenate reductase [Yoonia maritima]|uniref:Arsenate reductase n=1 Tax=Yoonia maritima TaxID=1435347 RepID=A0A2T0W1Q5_9RHOB|nr:arsenate reductase (glutaredoxin) [Yoonia maritima]PRY78938.1 arsenate reductase [Yoonia maritima]